MALVQATAERLISIALRERGYLEKATLSQLDSLTANAGYKNYTKYARDLDAIQNFYNGKKQGVAWCDMFVDWCMLTAFGLLAGQKLLCQPDRSYGAGCPSSVNYYKEKGRFYTSNPKPGDQIFFWNSAKTYPAHTGLVTNVDKQYVYTIEGNTSSQSGVVDNGGGVFEKKYSLSYHRICGYGRPDYENVYYDDTVVVVIPEGVQQTEKNNEGEFTLNMKTLKFGSKGENVKALQILLIGNGCPCGKWGADGDFGISTENAVKEYQRKKNLTADGVAGPLTWKSLLGVS